MAGLMTKEELIKLAYDIDIGDANVSLISSFNEKTNREIAAVLFAWIVSGDERRDSYVRDNVIYPMIKESPIIFTERHPLVEQNATDNPHGCFYKKLTNSNFQNLLDRIRIATTTPNESLEDFVLKYMSRGKPVRWKNTHDALSAALGGQTGFPISEACGTFFRYNLIVYWLAYKTRTWSKETCKNAILPLDQKAIYVAREYGILKGRQSHPLKNALELTKIAREWLGYDDFYRMYELLRTLD